MHAGHLMLSQRSLMFSSITFPSVLSASITVTVDMPPKQITLSCATHANPVQCICSFRYYSFISRTSVGSFLWLTVFTLSLSIYCSVDVLVYFKDILLTLSSNSKMELSLSLLQLDILPLFIVRWHFPVSIMSTFVKLVQRHRHTTDDTFKNSGFHYFLLKGIAFYSIKNHWGITYLLTAWLGFKGATCVSMIINLTVILIWESRLCSYITVLLWAQWGSRDDFKSHLSHQSMSCKIQMSPEAVFSAQSYQSSSSRSLPSLASQKLSPWNHI